MLTRLLTTESPSFIQPKNIIPVAPENIIEAQTPVLNYLLLNIFNEGRSRFKNSIVRPSDKSPLCFKWTLKLDGKQFSEIF